MNMGKETIALSGLGLARRLVKLTNSVSFLPTCHYDINEPDVSYTLKIP